MTVETDIVAALTSLVGGRVYPDVGPVGAVLPYITYQQIGGASVNFLERGVPDKKNGRFQVNVWSTTRLQAASINLLIETALVTSTAFQADAIGAPLATRDEETKFYGAAQDFSIWSVR